MVARGDLGVEIPTYEVPTAQKSIVEKCNREGKVVIVATQVCWSLGYLCDCCNNSFRERLAHVYQTLCCRAWVVCKAYGRVASAT